MDSETVFAVAAVVVVLVALAIAALVPGVLADPTDEGPTRPGPVGLTDVSIARGDVGGATATLQVDARLEHRGNPTPNVTVEFRAVDGDSGLLVTSETVDVGALEADREVPVGTALSVPREGSYRIETAVYRDGQRVASGTRRVGNIEALTPDAARTAVRFSDREALPPLSVSVARAGEGRTTLRVGATLSNRGDEPSDDLRVELVARQADSNLVADRASVAVGTVRPLRTGEATANLTVPTEYNYYLDAVLYRDGIVVDTARTAVNLDPSERIDVNTTVRETDLDVGDFERGSGVAASPTPTPMPTSAGQPGFGVGVAAVALVAAGLLARRWAR